ncbi:MAG: TetR family transcriptional regulator [Sandaracinus sp.]|mgnify:CR=1 FL=1|nr:TetR family transcriptional regulator [Sandaracinus sp.]|tara:strand:- start:144 stop:737 length:594 start_codon:yes stop_codon:yes gene_type:complete
MSARRTQAERRAATIAKLTDATIAVLADVGYAQASTKVICERAGCSQGALFRHFATRLDLVAEATLAIEARHLDRFATFFEGWGGKWPALAAFVRAQTRTPVHAAWREVVVAARTDVELRERVGPVLQRFETWLMAIPVRSLGAAPRRAEHAGMVFLSVLHLFDSEAGTAALHRNEELEAGRLRWAADILRREIAPD